MSDSTAQNEGKKDDGTQTKPTPEAEAAAIAAAAADKVTADKKKEDARLLDDKGNPKSPEVLAAEAAEAAKPNNARSDKEQEDLKSKVTGRAKQVEDLVKAAGVKPTELMGSADPETGELNIAHKAKLIEQHGEAIADLIEGNIQKMLNDTRKHMKAKDTAIYAQVETAFKGMTEDDGEASWKELAGWVKGNIDVDTRKVYNKMLAEGGMQATMAVNEMIVAFKKGNDLTISAQLIEGDSSTPTGGGGFITRSEYMKQLDVLQNAGHDYDTSPEIAKLNARRTKSMQSGK